MDLWVFGFLCGGVVGYYSNCGIYIFHLLLCLFVLFSLLTPTCFIAFITNNCGQRLLVKATILFISLFWGAFSTNDNLRLSSLYRMLEWSFYEEIEEESEYSSFYKTIDTAPICDDVLSLSGSGLRVDLQSEKWFGEYIRSMRGWIYRRLDRFSHPLRGWFYSILLGKKDFLSFRIKESFRDLGLYHLLVLSGLHITIFTFLISCFLFFPLKIIYSFRMINGYYWIHITSLSFLLLSLFLLVFIEVVGFSPPAQRSVIIYVFTHTVPFFIGRLSLSKKLLVAFFIQSLFFPKDIFSYSAVMSWGAYLILLSSFKKQRGCRSIHQKITAILDMQVRLMFLSWAFFSNVSGIAFLSNLLVAPFFPAVLSGALFLVMIGRQDSFDWIYSILEFIQLGFIGGVGLLADKWGSWFGGRYYIDGGDLQGVLEFCLWVLVCLFFLKAINVLSSDNINSY